MNFPGPMLLALSRAGRLEQQAGRTSLPDVQADLLYAAQTLRGAAGQDAGCIVSTQRSDVSYGARRGAT